MGLDIRTVIYYCIKFGHNNNLTVVLSVVVCLAILLRLPFKAKPIQHFRFDTDTDIFVLIPINKFYLTDIITLLIPLFINQY